MIYLVTDGMPGYMPDNAFYVQVDNVKQVVLDELDYFLKAWPKHEIYYQNDEYVSLYPHEGESGPPWIIEAIEVELADLVGDLSSETVAIILEDLNNAF